MPIALNDAGKPVDWWFMYKVSGHSKTTGNLKVTGGEYIYYDSGMASNKAKILYSPNRVDKGTGALCSTLAQLYGSAATANKDLGWYFYNDENPINKQVNDDLGHTKGVVAFDLKANTAFWLVESTPLFPDPRKLQYPNTGLPMAQTFLCITLQNAATAALISKTQYSAQQPNVYAASAIPAAIAKIPNDYRLLLMQKKLAQGTTPLTADVPFKSKGGEAFRCIAKNKYWGQDFYNDLVGPRLHENLDVETWEHDPVPGSADDVKSLSVTGMKSVDLNPLGVGIEWSEEDDHAKLAISTQAETQKWVCVGDINFTLAQEKRGGGTVAFLCPPLWDELIQILEVSDVTAVKPKVAAAAAGAGTSTTKSNVPAKKAAAKSAPATRKK
jgi:deoxyribonuclease-2